MIFVLGLGKSRKLCTQKVIYFQGFIFSVIGDGNVLVLIDFSIWKMIEFGC